MLSVNDRKKYIVRQNHELSDITANLTPYYLSRASPYIFLQCIKCAYRGLKTTTKQCVYWALMQHRTARSEFLPVSSLNLLTSQTSLYFCNLNLKSSTYWYRISCIFWSSWILTATDTIHEQLRFLWCFNANSSEQFLMKKTYKQVRFLCSIWISTEVTLPKLMTSNTLSDLSLETEQRNVPLELAARSCIAPRWLRKCFTNSISSSSFFQNFMWPSQLPVIMKSVLWVKQKDMVCSNNYG